MPRTVAEWDRRYSVKRSIWSHKTNPALRTHVAPIAPGRPLDLGAGKGRSTIWLAKQGWHVAAVDFSSVALAKAEGYAVEAGDSGRIALQSADVTKTTPEEFSFDLVCLMYLHLSHDDMPVIVGKAVDARGPVGAFVLLGHDEINLKHGFGGPHEPNCFYGPEDILEAAGPALSVSETTRVESTRETAFGPRPAIECWVTSQRKPMS
ncbi:MAG: class I SAM-dependent methyltransferase [Pseudomonadota bacterium]